MTARILFVTGTDTGVGKTYASAAICAEAMNEGLRVRYVKPIQTGVIDAAHADAALVLKLVQQLAPGQPRAPLPRVGDDEPTTSAFTAHELLRFAPPLAPAVAAALAARPIHIGRLVRSTHKLAQTCDLLVVEGAGGLLVPIGAEDTMAELAHRIGGGLVIVARPGLGTLNHTLLTVEAANARKLRIDRIVLTPWDDGAGTLEQENLRILRARTHVRVAPMKSIDT